jgi:hypothetical protein
VEPRILAGTDQGLHFLKAFAQRTVNTNVILLGAPHRYDLPSLSCVNSEVKLFNERLQCLMLIFNHVRFLVYAQKEHTILTMDYI